MKFIKNSHKTKKRKQILFDFAFCLCENYSFSNAPILLAHSEHINLSL